MRRAIIIVLHWSRIGGLEAVNIELAKELANLGWQVEVIAVLESGTEEWFGPIHVRRLAPIGWLRSRWWGRGGWKTDVLRVVRSALARDVDERLLILGHAWLLPMLRRGGKTLCGCRKWLWVYGNDVWGMAGVRARKYVGRVDEIIAISEFTRREFLHEQAETASRVIPVFVDVRVFRPTTTPDRINRHEMLICGRMALAEQYKGHELLLRSIPLIRKLSGLPATLTVIGDGDGRHRLEALSREQGLESVVSFRGRVGLNELVSAYQHCGVFVMPSRLIRRERDLWMGEGFGIVYIEAAACGRPVVASREGGAAEAILPGVTGLLVNPGSMEDVASSVASLLRDPQKADQMGQEGRRFVEARFSREVFVAKLKGLLAEQKWVKEPES